MITASICLERAREDRGINSAEFEAAKRVWGDKMHQIYQVLGPILMVMKNREAEFLAYFEIIDDNSAKERVRAIAIRVAQAYCRSGIEKAYVQEPQIADDRRREVIKYLSFLTQTLLRPVGVQALPLDEYDRA